MAYNLVTLEGFGNVGQVYDNRDRRTVDHENRPMYDEEYNENSNDMESNEQPNNYVEDRRVNYNDNCKTEKLLKYILVFCAGMVGGQYVKKVFKD